MHGQFCYKLENYKFEFLQIKSTWSLFLVTFNSFFFIYSNQLEGQEGKDGKTLDDRREGGGMGTGVSNPDIDLDPNPNPGANNDGEGGTTQGYKEGKEGRRWNGDWGQ